MAAAGRQSTDSFMFHNGEQRAPLIIIIKTLIIIIIIKTLIITIKTLIIIIIIKRGMLKKTPPLRRFVNLSIFLDEAKLLEAIFRPFPNPFQLKLL